MYAPTGGRDTGPHPGPAPSTAGPHRHDILNKLDPTVDSQHGGVQILGPGVNATAAGSNTAAPPVAAARGSDNYAATGGSRLHEQLDPRADGRTDNTVPTGSTAAAGVAAPGMSGPPSFNIRQQCNAQNPTRGANNLDTYTEPGFDGRQPAGRQNAPGTVPVQAGGFIQPGPAPNTAGPQRHDVMNKLDPTVNSKATFQQQAQYRTA